MGKKNSLNRRTFLTATGVGLLASVGVAAEPGEARDRRRERAAREVVVGVSATANDHRRSVEKHVPENAHIARDTASIRAVTVRFNENANDRARERFKERIRQEEHIKYAEDNEMLSAQYLPNDSRYGDQYADQMVNCETAWDVTLGSSAVSVAVVDQGVKYDHPDLDGNMDGSVSNAGSDFVDDDADPYPDVLADEYHGTHVAGIAAAETDNGEGVSGIGNSSVISGRALSEEGTGSTSDIADAVTWAADQGADVINLSLGGGSYTSTMKNAVSYATDQGALVVAAAGNDYGGPVSYPAAYSECLAVSALDPDGSLANYSNVGSEVELCAPGTNVLSTWTDDAYNAISGTSMATPVVAGVAGLTLAAWDLSNAELRQHLKDTAADMGLSSNQQGSGRVDAGAAVTTEPGTGGGGGGGGGSDSSSVTDSLSGYADSACWTYAWTYSNPSQVVIELDGPANADFDLYANDGTGTCPTTYSYDYRSWTTNSKETIIIDSPDDSTDLHVLVDSYSGSGSYTLTITEYE